MEEFLEIYDITKEGKCINKKTRHVKKTFISNTGYERVSLWNKGKNKKYSINMLKIKIYFVNFVNIIIFGVGKNCKHEIHFC